MEAAKLGGDKELALVEGGESTEDESRLECWWERVPSSMLLGLSFPVGPFPRGARFAGGKLSACRRQAFSSSSSETLSSKA
jgi:hypothetical protein